MIEDTEMSDTIVDFQHNDYSPGQQHQLTISSQISEILIITRVLLSLGSHASNNTSSCSLSSAVPHPVVGGTAFAGQHDPP